MKLKHLTLLSLFFSLITIIVFPQNNKGWENALKEKKSFIEEKGQFKEFLEKIDISIQEPIICGIVNEEFNAYITKEGLYFVFPKQTLVKEESRRREDKGKYKSSWNKIAFKWHSNAPTNITSIFKDKQPFYYSYSAIHSENINKFNFINGYKEFELKNIFEGCDIIFELPEEGGIKYRLVVQNTLKKSFDFYWEGIERIEDIVNSDVLKIHTKFLKKEDQKNEHFHLTDKKPFAFLQKNRQPVDLKYKIKDNTISFVLPENLNETIIIDPWIQNPNFPDLNRAYDVQTDAAGNVIVLGNYSQAASGRQFHIKKYDAAGTFLWDYTYYSKFLGDIAVDNAGNIYHIGQYPTGRRVKLDPSATAIWSTTGLSEEWRLAFNFDKSILSIGGNFVTPNANLGSINLTTGVLSNLILYSEETRAITTDCTGDIYALTIPSGSTCNLRKISNFTLINTVPSGFPVNYRGTGYAINPDYNPNIYQGFNGIIIDGDFIYIYNGTQIRKFNKLTLAFISSVNPPNSSYMQCSGLAVDYCGNLYVGTTAGLVVYNANLTQTSTIATPGTVYDVILANDGSLLVSGDSFMGNYASNCALPDPFVGTTSTVSCEQGSISVSLNGGVLPYSYQWGPNGETTSSITNLSAGEYTIEAKDKFCNSYIDTITINPLPHAEFSLQDSCEYNAVTFTDASTITATDAITAYSWDIDNDGLEDYNIQNPNHLYTAGNYTAKLTVTSGNGCVKDTTMSVTVHPKPQGNFTFSNECLYDSVGFIDNSTILNPDAIMNYSWNFGENITPLIQSTVNNPYHTYSTAGTFNVVEMLTSNNGCLDTVVHQVTIYDVPSSDFTFLNTCDQTVANFNNTSIANGSAISSYQWDYTNDGTTDFTGADGSHTFTSPNTYTVELIVENLDGCSDTTTHDIVIFPNPVANFSTSNACEGSTVNFTNTSTIASGTITSNYWNFSNETITDIGGVKICNGIWIYF